MTRIAPGGTIGIFGGGQLGRMTALAAARLGYRCHIFCPEADSPAAEISATATIAGYDDLEALDSFCASIDVATFEFENVPYEAVARIAARTPVRPGWEALRTSQDRAVEKRFLNSIGLETPCWTEIRSASDLRQAPCPGILKTTRFGYDGKGQVQLQEGFDAETVWAIFGAERGVAEMLVDFSHEVSVIVARGADGSVALFDVAQNHHRGGILRRTLVPAPVSSSIKVEAQTLAARAAEALDLVGLLAVEFFVTRSGQLLANEIAPRPHNSGHWTQDACGADQFEQFVRAVAGLPLADPARHSDAEMVNLIGDDVHAWPNLLAEPGARLHLYGKHDIRPGRKMGHVNRLSPKARRKGPEA